MSGLQRVSVDWRKHLGPPLLMVASGASLYTGAALAVGLFAHFPPAVVAWLRILAAALVLLVLVRPPLSAFRGRAGRTAVLFGLVTAGMNGAFYEAIARLPLGTAVAVEFLGPILIAALGLRTWRHAASLLAAGVGVALIADVQLVAEPVGMAWIGLAAALWAAYILLGKTVATGDNPRAGMCVGFLGASVLTSPVLLTVSAPPADLDPVQMVGIVLGLGVLSAVIPYGLDQVILARTGPDYFAILLALLPLTATVIGVVGLQQYPTTAELLGIIAIVCAVILRSDRDRPAPEELGPQPLVAEAVVAAVDDAGADPGSGSGTPLGPTR